jgi:hypothetical protein
VLRVVVILAVVVACGDNIDASGESHGLRDLAVEWLTSEGALHGTVYTCNSVVDCGGLSEEWCFEGPEEDLEGALGLGPDGCWPIKVSERAWPALVGCAYCCGPDCGPGSNAHCGAMCFPEEQ